MVTPALLLEDLLLDLNSVGLEACVLLDNRIIGLSNLKELFWSGL